MKGDIEAVILDVTKEDTIEAVRAKVNFISKRSTNIVINEFYILIFQVENSGLPLVAVVNNAGASGWRMTCEKSSSEVSES